MKIKVTKYRNIAIWEVGLSGKLNNTVYCQLNSKTYIRKPPGNYDKTSTPKQAAARERFKQAQLFAMNVINDPALKAVYEKKAGGKRTAYSTAISEWLSGKASS